MIIQGGEVALPGSEKPVKVDIRVDGGVITGIGADLSVAAGAADEHTIDATGLLVLPGAIDSHVHFNDPGFTEREDFDHGTAAACSGGVTTVIDMPCTSIPPVTSRANLETKRNRIGPKARVDFGLFGGVHGDMTFAVLEQSMTELADLVCGFKCYFISGMPTFPRVDHHRFHQILGIAASLDTLVLLHAEDYEYVTGATSIAQVQGTQPRLYYESRPEASEILAVKAAASLASLARAQLHIVHLGTPRAREVSAGDFVTYETAPHYLAFSCDDLDRYGGSLKTTPPVKQPENRELLWKAIADGSLSFVASDHAPAPAAAKNTGSIWTDYAGLPGTGTLLPFMISEGYMKGRLSLSRLCEVTASAQAKRFGLSDRKGEIAVGRDADFALIDLSKTWRVRGTDLFSKGTVTPFEGWEFTGRVVRTIVRGITVYRDGEIVGPKGHGRFMQPNRGIA